MSKRSTGPRSAEGKARSSMNALKTGIYSESWTIPGENSDHLDLLIREYYDHHRPASPEQRDLVDTLIRCAWFLRRYAVAEASMLTREINKNQGETEETELGCAVKYTDTVLARLHRIIASTERTRHEALRDLERLRTQPQPIETTPDCPAPRVDETNSPQLVPPPPSITPSPSPGAEEPSEIPIS